MDRTIKTRTVARDVKTLNRRMPATRALKAAGREAKDEIKSIANPARTPDERQGASIWAESRVESAAVATAHGTTKAATSAGRRAKEDAVKRMRRGAHKKADGRTKERPAKPKRSVRTAPKGTKRMASFSAVGTDAGKSGAGNPGAQAVAARARKASFDTRSGAAIPKRAAASRRRAAKRAARSFARMAAASARSLAAALAGVGGLSASVVVIVCLVGLVTASAFGIFFAGGDMGDGNPTLRQVVAEIDAEHTARIEEAKAANPHDEVVMAGSKVAWKEALAVFATRATTDPQNPLDAITMDAQRQALLREVYWSMNQLIVRVEERAVVEVVLEDDGQGNLVETSAETTKKTLFIELVCKSADEAAAGYGFTSEQADLLRQLLDTRYDSAWRTVLYGAGRLDSGDIVEAAASQIGNVGGQPYWSWYGFESRVEWCACFVSWCANECGYIEQGIVPKFSYCPTGVQWFKDAGRWQDRGYTPQPGDIIFFDWGGDGTSDHVGIVESCDGSTVYTIEGNSGDACQRSSYSIGSASIMGYGAPLY